jgi:hypothetical protein
MSDADVQSATIPTDQSQARPDLVRHLIMSTMFIAGTSNPTLYIFIRIHSVHSTLHTIHKQCHLPKESLQTQSSGRKSRRVSNTQTYNKARLTGQRSRMRPTRMDRVKVNGPLGRYVSISVSTS